MPDDASSEGVTVEYDASTDTYQVRYDEDKTPPSLAVTLAIGEITETEASDLVPLYDAVAIDLEALDELFGPTGTDSFRKDGHVTFLYTEYEITVYSEAYTEIRPLNGDAD